MKYLSSPRNMLIYHGSPGIGKTYFCAALIQWACERFNCFRYHTDKELLSRLRKGIADGSGEYLEHLEYLIDDDLIFLDDVGSSINPDKFTMKDLEWRREILFAFLDYRYNSQKPTIITSNLNKEEFTQIYSERIASRMFAAENTIISLFGTEDKRAKGM